MRFNELQMWSQKDANMNSFVPESKDPLPRLLDRSIKVCRNCRIPRFDGDQAIKLRTSAVMTRFSDPN